MTSKERCIALMEYIVEENQGYFDKERIGKDLTAILEDLKKLEYYEYEKYKHWNIFFNGAKLEYLLYLEKKGKESFMTSISEELFSKIKKHFSDEERD